MQEVAQAFSLQGPDRLWTERKSANQAVSGNSAEPPAGPSWRGGLAPRERGGSTSAPVSDSGSPIYLLADEARQARQAALASMVAALPPWPHTSSGTPPAGACAASKGGADLRACLPEALCTRLARPRCQRHWRRLRAPAGITSRRPCSRTTPDGIGLG